MLEQMADIFTRVLLPVLAMTGLGALIQSRLSLDLATLVKLNLYLFVPAFLFVRVYESELSWAEIGGVGLAVLLPMALLALPVYWVLWKRRISGGSIAAVLVGGLFFNAGNFGIPVAELAFGEAGGAVQALVVMFVNTTIFLVGYVVLAMAQGHGVRAALGYFRLPMIYVIVAALAMREADAQLPGWLSKAVETVAAGMVPVALVTLGAQLVTRFRLPRWRLVGLVMGMKLAALPALTAAVVWGLGLWPWPGTQLILASAGPTAVNTLLLTLELEGDAATAADCVFWTTLASAATVTVVLTILLALGGGPG